MLQRFQGWPRWAQWAVGISVVLLVIGIAGASEDEPKTVSAGNSTQSSANDEPATTAAKAPKVTVDKRVSQSKLACTHFRNVAGDVSKGVLTDAELRKKLKEIDDNAIIATLEVQRAATAMLAGITTGTTEQLLQAFRDMDSACDAAGQ